jgi:lipopolysaccharide export system permease protein
LIIDRHLVRQFAIPSFVVSAILATIFVGYSLSRFLTHSDGGLLNSAEIMQLTLLKVLIAMEVLLPIGLFFGLILGLGKLHSDSEIAALQASGVSEYSIVRPVLMLAIPVALVVAILSIYGRPWAYTQTYAMLAVAEASSDIDRIKPGQFYLTRSAPPSTSTAGEDSYTYGSQEATVEDLVEEERAVFIEKISPKQVLDQVFIRTRTGDEIEVIAAESGLLIERPSAQFHTLELDNARIFKRVEDGPDLVATIQQFTIRVKNEQPQAPEYKAKAETSAKLKTSTHPEDQSEYQWRYSTAIATVLFALLAVPLSRSKPRQGRYAKLLLAFTIYAAYYNLIEVGRTWVEQQRTSSLWWAPLLLGVVVAVAYLPWYRLQRAARGGRR